MNTRKALESIEKDELIELIMSYADEGYYPVELFAMASDKYTYTLEDLEEKWEDILDKANAFEDDANPKAADLLKDASTLVFNQAKKLSKGEAKDFLSRVAEDLSAAASEDGIGCQTDSEWLYLDVQKEIEKYLK